MNIIIIIIVIVVLYLLTCLAQQERVSYRQYEHKTAIKHKHKDKTNKYEEKPIVFKFFKLENKFLKISISL